MAAQVTLVRVHETAGVRQIIAAAMEIADDAERVDREWIAVFEQACTLLAARIPVAEAPVPVALPFHPQSLRA